MAVTDLERSTHEARPSNLRDGGARSERHLPALDGLRGVAILLVIFFHSWITPTLGGLHHTMSFLAGIGWSGVELFFVLSGFLITGILLDARGAEGYFRNFYARRVLRIFPLYYGLLAAYFAVTAVHSSWAAALLGRAAGQQLWYVLFLSNYSMASHGAWPSGLGVTWSLAIEEQFYLIWPFLVWLLSRRWVLRLSVLLFFLSFAWRLGQVAVGVHPGVTYLLTPSHFGALSAGAAIAAQLREPGGIDKLVPWSRHLLIVIPLTLLPLGAHAQQGGMYWSNLDPWMVTVGVLLIQLFFATALVAVLGLRGPGRVLGFLRSPALRACGRWSYGMYLFHPFVVIPLQALARHRAPHGAVWALSAQLLVTAMTIVVTAGLAAFSWNVYEKRFLKLKRLFPRRGKTRRVPVPGFGGEEKSRAI